MFTYVFSMLASILVASPAVDLGTDQVLVEKVAQAKIEQTTPNRKSAKTRARKAKQNKPVTKTEKASDSSLAQDAAPPTEETGTERKPEDKVQQVLNSVQSFYSRTADLKAKFTQTYTYKVYGRTQVSEGRVFFKKPGMMRWDYRKPVPKVFVADGQNLWIYEPQENQYFKRALTTSQLPIALSFMSGEGRLADEFEAKLIGQAAQTYTLELIPRKDASDYQSLVLEVNKATYAVRSSTVVDPVGNTNQLVFERMVVNSGLPDSGFKFKAPKGVREIKVP